METRPLEKEPPAVVAIAVEKQGYFQRNGTKAERNLERGKKYSDLSLFLPSNLLLVVSIGQTQQEAGEGCSPWGVTPHTPHPPLPTLAHGSQRKE